jgi:hypothetical protein
MAFSLFYLSAVLIALVGIGALVRMGIFDKVRRERTSAGTSAETTPVTKVVTPASADHVQTYPIPQMFFASESHRLNVPLTMVLL